MRKIPTLFVRDERNPRLVTERVTPGCEWVLEGRGVATIKWDGTATMVREGKLYKRLDFRPRKRTGTAPVEFPPRGFIPTGDPDPQTGRQLGWVPCWSHLPENKWHWLAFQAATSEGQEPLPDWTYELCGPSFNGNPHVFTVNSFLRHGKDVLLEAPRTFEGLMAYLSDVPHGEGIVWWLDPHDMDSPRAKIKMTDMGLLWPPRRQRADDPPWS